MAYVVVDLEGEITALNLNQVQRIVHETKGGTENLEVYFDKKEKYTIKDMTMDQFLHDLPRYRI